MTDKTKLILVSVSLGISYIIVSLITFFINPTSLFFYKVQGALTYILGFGIFIWATLCGFEEEIKIGFSFAGLFLLLTILGFIIIGFNLNGYFITQNYIENMGGYNYQFYITEKLTILNLIFTILTTIINFIKYKN